MDHKDILPNNQISNNTRVSSSLTGAMWVLTQKCWSDLVECFYVMPTKNIIVVSSPNPTLAANRSRWGGTDCGASALLTGAMVTSSWPSWSVCPAWSSSKSTQKTPPGLAGQTRARSLQYIYCNHPQSSPPDWSCWCWYFCNPNQLAFKWVMDTKKVENKQQSLWNGNIFDI